MHTLLWLYYHKYLKGNQTFEINKKRLTHTIYMLQSFDTGVFVKPQTSGFGTKIRTGVYEQSKHFSLSGVEFPCTDREQSASILSYGEYGNEVISIAYHLFFFRFLLFVLLSLALNPIWLWGRQLISNDFISYEQVRQQILCLLYWWWTLSSLAF